MLSREALSGTYRCFGRRLLSNVIEFDVGSMDASIILWIHLGLIDKQHATSFQFWGVLLGTSLILAWETDMRRQLHFIKAAASMNRPLTFGVADYLILVCEARLCPRRHHLKLTGG